MLGTVEVAARQRFQYPVHCCTAQSIVFANLHGIFSAKFRRQVFDVQALVVGQAIESCRSGLGQFFEQKKGVLDEDVCQSVHSLVIRFRAMDEARRIPPLNGFF